jgi:hypothetical protein
MSNKKVEFETFIDITEPYRVSQLKKDKPSTLNFLEYRKFKVVIELVEEPDEVLIKRLEDLLEGTRGWDRKQRIKEEIKKIQDRGLSN